MPKQNATLTKEGIQVYLPNVVRTVSIESMSAQLMASDWLLVNNKQSDKDMEKLRVCVTLCVCLRERQRRSELICHFSFVSITCFL